MLGGPSTTGGSKVITLSRWAFSTIRGSKSPERSDGKCRGTRRGFGPAASINGDGKLTSKSMQEIAREGEGIVDAFMLHWIHMALG